MEKLNSVIVAFAEKDWFAPTKARIFIANHIYVKEKRTLPSDSTTEQVAKNTERNRLIDRQRTFNLALNTLNGDIYDGRTLRNGDISLHTCSNESELVETIPDPNDEVHFSARTLFSIGASVAEKYLNRSDIYCGDKPFKR